MTKTTTGQGRRLPRGMKKKLEASLTSLTPRQAGRLYVLYVAEATRKDIYPGDYPPIKELFAAWNKRADDVKKTNRRDEMLQVMRLYCGFVLLTEIVNEVNNWAQGEGYRLLLAAQMAGSRLRQLLLEDSTSEVARMAMGLLSDSPRPVSFADYEIMTQWRKGGATTDLGELAGELAEKWGDQWAQDHGLQELRVDRAFWEAHKEDFEDEMDVSRFMETRELRAMWVKEVGERLLTEVFKGDRQALEDWVAVGGFAGPGFTTALVDAKSDEIYSRLVAMVEAGELKGGPAFYGSDRGLFGPVVIHEGKLPAWAALRAVWRGWLYDHGFFVREDHVVDPQAIDGLYSVYDVEGDLEGDRLTQVAGEFLADCRARPWGEGLKPDIDPAKLGRFLIEVESPLTEITAPPWGLVDWEAFRSREGDESQEWELDYVATIESLNAHGPALGFGPVTYSDAYVESMYYATDDPAWKRTTLSHVNRLLKSIRFSRRAFTYSQEERQPIAGFLGVEFATPLEETVKVLGQVFGQVATFFRILDLLSEEYFGGLPALTQRNTELRQLLESGLANAEEELADWLKRLKSPIWSVDTSSLQLVKEEADEDEARDWVIYIVETARRRLQFDPGQFDLGDDDAKGKTQ